MGASKTQLLKSLQILLLSKQRNIVLGDNYFLMVTKNSKKNNISLVWVEDKVVYTTRSDSPSQTAQLWMGVEEFKQTLLEGGAVVTNPSPKTIKYYVDLLRSSGSHITKQYLEELIETSKKLY